MDTNNCYTEEYIQSRIAEIDTELEELYNLKKNNRITSDDIEDVSDNYQYHLEWNYLIEELNAERQYLIQERNKLHEVD